MMEVLGYDMDLHLKRKNDLCQRCCHKFEFVTTLLSQISWSNHLAILSKAKTEQERHFYISLCIKENYSARELSRQIDSGYYERYMLSKEKILPGPMKGLKENPFLGCVISCYLCIRPHLCDMGKLLPECLVH